MATRKYHRKTKKSKPDKSKKRIRKTRSKKQGGAKMPYVGPYYENPSAKLWDVVYKNNYKKVEEAFKEGADVNMKHDNGVWFLLVASGHGNARTVNLLLEKGIDVNITDDYDYDNNTALSTAVINAKYDVVELLLEKGADINKENNKGDTPLIHAIRFEDYDMVELLLEKGADINKENNKGDTPLIHAIDNGDYYMVEFLLKMGADVTDKELFLAEGLTEWDEEQNGIPYLLEEEIIERNNIRRKANDAFISVANDKVKNSPRKSIAKVLGQYVKYQDKNGDNNKVRPLAEKIMRYAGIDKEYIERNKIGKNSNM